MKYSNKILSLHRSIAIGLKPHCSACPYQAKLFGGLLVHSGTNSLSLYDTETVVDVSGRRKAMIAGGGSAYCNNHKNNLRQSLSIVNTEESSVDDEEYPINSKSSRLSW